MLLVGVMALACLQVETAAGIKEGGRTGLTAITIGVLFLCSIFLAPLFGKVRRMSHPPTPLTSDCLISTAAALELEPHPGHVAVCRLTVSPRDVSGIQVPQTATAPILILVGAMMMGESGKIEWADMQQAVPAFFTTVMMPFSYRWVGGRRYLVPSHVSSSSKRP